VTGMSEFEPSRLTLARQRRAKTKIDLATQIDLTDRSISAYESGDAIPTENTLAKIAKALEFPPEFFAGPPIETPSAATASFRSLKSLTAGRRHAVLAAGALAIEFAHWIDQRFATPDPNVPDLRECHPETAAEVLRAQWRLGEQPVLNMVHCLESKGIKIFSLSEECASVDAFSVWRDETPFVFLNTFKTAEHGRFDAAHELGHLVLHRHGARRGPPAESQANRFASAFLMPRGSVASVAVHFPKLDHLIKLKKIWRVSVAAFVVRLHELGHLTDWHYRSLFIELAGRGYRKSEPESVPRETSQVLDKVFSALRREGVRKADVARDLRISVTELDRLVFGLTLAGIQGGGKGSGRSTDTRGKLHLIE
jgi:Zn-dependent peptidase ImmA (M78 family)/DNA-binding XRE family transcriptional regulator